MCKKLSLNSWNIWNNFNKTKDLIVMLKLVIGIFEHMYND